MGSQQFVITGRESTSGNGLSALGDRSTVIGDLFNCNIGPERDGDDILYGPGFRLELTPDQDPLTQMLLTVMEDEIAWMVIRKMAHRFQWRLIDPITGRDWNP